MVSLPLLQCVPILPSVLSAGLREVSETEAVYSGVHPCLERAQRGDGSGEEVHSEVGLPAEPSPPACEPAVLQPRTRPSLGAQRAATGVQGPGTSPLLGGSPGAS